MKKRLVFSLLVMGLSGIVAQILLLRELLIIFCGNELTIGIILANWLIIEAIGAFWVGKRVENILHKLEGFIILQIIFSFSFPLAIYLTRTIREISGIVPGVGLGVGQVFLFSFLVIFPVSISHGALFTYGCKILSLYLPSETEAVGKVYIYETVGTILGGFILTYFLIPYFHSFQIVFWIILINLMFCILLLGKFWQKGKNILTKTLGIITSFLCFLSVVFLLNNGIDRIHNNSIARQWSKYRVKHYQNTFFGNIVVGEKDGALTFFFNGIPVVNLPTPDITCIEEFAHFSLLSHASPQEILIIGRGAGGVINEILKHPVTTVDYLEIDPIFLKILKNFSTPLIAQELDNPKVNTITLDGRFFLRRTEKKYDLILLGFSNPSDLQTNRYFTKEFFSLVRGRLKEEGIFVLSLPGLPRAILNLKEIKDLNACIFNTLKEVYTNIKVIPGEGINLFLASDSEEINLLNAQIFIERLKERKVFASMFNPDYIKYRFQTFWHENFFSSLKGATHRINRDFHPVATFYSLVYWNALFSPYLLKFFRNIENIIPFVLIFLFSLFILTFPFRKIGLSMALSISSTGFSAMLFNLILIFTFQVYYGYLFHWIGILVSVFMGGIALGGYFSTMNLGRIKNDYLYFSGTEISIFLFALFLPLIFTFTLGNPFIFLFLSLIGGILIGIQFPLANKIYLRNSLNLSKTAGLLYSADLLGGWLGGMLGGIFILPLLGVYGSCLVISSLKLASFIVFYFTRKT